MTPEYRSGELKNGPSCPLSIYAADVCAFQGLNHALQSKNLVFIFSGDVTTAEGTRCAPQPIRHSFSLPVPVPFRRPPTTRRDHTTYHQRH